MNKELQVRERWMKLVVSIMSEKTISLCEQHSDSWKILMDHLYSKINRLFSGKMFIQLQECPRWILYTLQDIGVKTGWWDVDIRNKKDVKGRSSGYYGQPIYRSKKIGDGRFTIDRQIRSQCKDKRNNKNILIYLYTKRNLDILFDRELPKDIVNLISEYIMPPGDTEHVDGKSYLCGCVSLKGYYHQRKPLPEEPGPAHNYVTYHTLITCKNHK